MRISRFAVVVAVLGLPWGMLAAGEPAAKLSAPQLREIVAPVALYTNTLLNLILSASTDPRDVALAVRYLDNGGDLAKVGLQPWPDSVKSLVRYPNVLHWMGQNPARVGALGRAFASQRDDVVVAIFAVRDGAEEAAQAMERKFPSQPVEVAKEDDYSASEPDTGFDAGAFDPSKNPPVAYLNPRYYKPEDACLRGIAGQPWFYFDPQAQEILARRGQ